MLKWECQGFNIYFLLLNGIYLGSKYVTKIDCLQSCQYNFFQNFNIEMPFLTLFGDWLVRLVIAAYLLIDETCVFTWLFYFTSCAANRFIKGTQLRSRLSPRKLGINLHGSSVYPSPRKSETVSIKHFDPILNRSKTSAIPWVPCKRKVDPCKFLSVQKFVRTRANVVLNSFVFV